MKIQSPLSGPIHKLETLPDPVFAQKMVGDGIAIDPIDGSLRAPIDGTVVQLHPAHHAISIRSADGFSILMHIGIDTVQLKGKGFQPRVKVGDTVRVGSPLIDFDLDFVAQNAASMVTPVLVVEPSGVKLNLTDANTISQGDFLFDVTDSAITGKSISSEKSQDIAAVWEKSDSLQVLDPTGLHARPAALITETARQFSAKVEIVRGQDRANAKSIVSIMALEIAGFQNINFQAQGADAKAALKTLTEKCRGLLAAPSAGATAAAAKPTAADTATDTATGNATVAAQSASRLKGVVASPGLAVGRIVQIRPKHFHVAEIGDGSIQENQNLTAALKKAKTELHELQEKVKTQSDAGKAAIFAAHLELLEDPDILQMTEDYLDAGKSAAWSWNKTIETHSARLESLSNELFKARASDLKDVGRRVLRLLLGQSENELKTYPATILIAENLTPSDTVSLDRNHICGFVTLEGGPTSHVAILARSLGIPALAGIEPRALQIADGTEVLLDGNNGLLQLDLSAADLEKIKSEQSAHEQERREAIAEAMKPALTTDDHHVEVFANIGRAGDAEEAVPLGAEGVGLLRSEFLFLERGQAPSEEDQRQAYQEVVDALGPSKPLTIRTLDVGGDKPLKYLPLPKEENPFLGVRGLRLGLRYPEILRTQLRAILRTESNKPLRIMFPMVTTLEEVLQAKTILFEERASLGLEHKPISVGIMVEVPSAALEAESLAPHVDFFSIGTNDLTQYTLAVDRGHPELAKDIDALHPSVLRLIQMTVNAAHKHGKWVGVCGGIASDLKAVPILIGLGVDELSVSVPAIPMIKAGIRKLNFKECQKLAQGVLK